MTQKEAGGGITVGDLMRQLRLFPDGAELHFGGLRFYRLKTRGDDSVQLEFQENVFRNAQDNIVIMEA